MPVPESRTTSRCQPHQIYPKILQSGSIAQAFFNSPRHSRLELLRVLGTRNFRHIFRIDNHITFPVAVVNSLFILFLRVLSAFAVRFKFLLSWLQNTVLFELITILYLLPPPRHFRIPPATVPVTH